MIYGAQTEVTYFPVSTREHLHDVPAHSTSITVSQSSPEQVGPWQMPITGSRASAVASVA